MDKDQFDQLSRRIDLIICLLLRSQSAKQTNSMILRDQIKWLDSQKLRPVEIAKILGKTQPFINKELSVLRRGLIQTKEAKENDERR